jgi:hypothetical protein
VLDSLQMRLSVQCVLDKSKARFIVVWSVVEWARYHPLGHVLVYLL